MLSEHSSDSCFRTTLTRTTFRGIRTDVIVESRSYTSSLLPTLAVSTWKSDLPCTMAHLLSDQTKSRARFKFHRCPLSFQQGRIEVARITTTGLSPATYRPARASDDPKDSSWNRPDDVPIWLDLTGFPSDTETITERDFA
jgi:hypothetical protein